MIPTASRADAARSKATSWAIQQSMSPSPFVYMSSLTFLPRSVLVSMPKVDSAIATPFSFMKE